MNYNKLRQRMCAFVMAITMPLTLSSCVKDNQDNNNISYGIEEFNEQSEIDLENKYIEFLSDYYNKTIDEIRIIEDDIYFTASAIVDLYNLGMDFKNENIDPIISRFPLLEAILKPKFINVGEYDNFIEDSGVSLIKNK